MFGRFDNGAVLSIEASFSLNIEKDEGKIELFGTKAGAKLDPELTLYSQQVTGNRPCVAREGKIDDQNFSVSRSWQRPCPPP